MLNRIAMGCKALLDDMMFAKQEMHTAPMNYCF